MVRTVRELEDDINEALADNSATEIDQADIRQVLLDLIDTAEAQFAAAGATITGKALIVSQIEAGLPGGDMTDKEAELRRLYSNVVNITIGWKAATETGTGEPPPEPDPEEPEPPPPPPSVGSTAIWSWDKAALSPLKEAYDLSVANNSTIQANGRPKPDAPFSGEAVSVGVLRHSSGYEQPTMDDDDRFVMASAADMFNAHRMLLCHNPDSDKFTAGYLECQETYEFNMEVDFTLTSAADWVANRWALFFQMHPGSFPGASQWDQTKKSPPIALSVQAGGLMTLSVRGSTEEVPTAYTAETVLNWEFEPAVIKLRALIHQDYTGENSLVRISEVDSAGNAVVKAEVEHSNSINHSGYGAGVERMTPTWGWYGGHGPVVYPSLAFNSFEIREFD